MSAAATTAATAVSLVALGRLAAGDPKRRRAFRLPAQENRRAGLLWAAALAPGLLVPFWSGAAGFFVWLGAVSVFGWVAAAISPDRNLALRMRLAEGFGRAAGAVAPALAAGRRAVGRIRRAGGTALARPAAAVPAGYAELERRVRELEAEVAALRAAAAEAEPGATVIELAGRR